MILVLHATRNSPPSPKFPLGRKDATGKFIPRAQGFESFYGRVAPVLVRGFDNLAPAGASMREVEALISSSSPTRTVTMVVILCHGFRNRLDTGHSLLTVKRLARVLRAVCVDDVRIALMACSTAASRGKKKKDGEGGFADALRDELVTLGCRGGWIDGHTTAGGATENPFVRRMRMERVDGGEWIVEPQSTKWEKWRAMLKKDLQFRFPALELEQIRNLL